MPDPDSLLDGNSLERKAYPHPTCSWSYARPDPLQANAAG
jgi:hypothetical protein